MADRKPLMDKRPVEEKASAPATSPSDDAKAAARARDTSSSAGDDGKTNHKSPKKRRKVNHACVYCRRSHMTCDLERPCTRCIKRNIGHLCHDEPREADNKKHKPNNPPTHPLQHHETPDDGHESQSEVGRSSLASMGPPTTAFDSAKRRTSSGFGAGMLAQRGPLPTAIVQPGASTGLQGTMLAGPNNNSNQFAGFSDAWMTAQNFHDMNTYNSNYMIPEVTHEFNLLNDFLHTSILDDGGIAPEDLQQTPTNEQGAKPDVIGGFGSNSSTLGDTRGQLSSSRSMLPPPNMEGQSIARPGSAVPTGMKDKTREYYLQAADPSGNDNPEQRMARVLKAKYDAGLLKPFNYVNGYARMGRYLDGHIASSSKQKILRTISHFRPKFREKAQGLTDMQLVYVEMWFEKQLMEYDRVFASMAVPACCWRRTGEIFRGNKEMAELIDVPVDKLRDGKIALHEILTEESMVRYWEEFGTIAFDPAHDTLLTACALKNPSDTSDHPVVKCCFSFSIRRDEHKMPALIVGNFLPHDPPKSE